MKTTLLIAALLSMAIATPIYGRYRWGDDNGDDDNRWRYGVFGGYYGYGGYGGNGDYNGMIGYGGGYGRMMHGWYPQFGYRPYWPKWKPWKPYYRQDY